MKAMARLIRNDGEYGLRSDNVLVENVLDLTVRELIEEIRSNVHFDDKLEIVFDKEVNSTEDTEKDGIKKALREHLMVSELLRVCDTVVVIVGEEPVFLKNRLNKKFEDIEFTKLNNLDEYHAYEETDDELPEHVELIDLFLGENVLLGRGMFNEYGLAVIDDVEKGILIDELKQSIKFTKFLVLPNIVMVKVNGELLCIKNRFDDAELEKAEFKDMTEIVDFNYVENGFDEIKTSNVIYGSSFFNERGVIAIKAYEQNRR